MHLRQLRMSIGAERLRDLVARLPRGAPVPAISLRQPWASAVVLLGKDVENRKHWPYKYRGPIVVHASRSRIARQDLDAAVRIARADEVPEQSIRLVQPSPGKYDPAILQQGVIMGLAHLTDVFGPDDEVPEEHPVASSPWVQDTANYWLCLQRIAPVLPHGYAGRVGLFKIPYDVVAALKPLTA